jgi:hypothetical protein
LNLPIWPLDGALDTAANGGTKAKHHEIKEKITLFNCHFMPLNWPIFGIFPSSPAAPYPGLYCHTNISLIS